MKARIKDIIKEKGSAVYTIDKSATVFEAIGKLADKGVGALVVTSGDLVCGIVTERDYLRKVALEGRESKTTSVEQIMTKDVIVATPDYDAEECMAIMTEKRIRHLPVIDGGRLAGMVSVGDLVKRVAKDRKFHIEHLTGYITGKYPA